MKYPEINDPVNHERLGSGVVMAVVPGSRRPVKIIFDSGECVDFVGDKAELRFDGVVA